MGDEGGCCCRCPEPGWGQGNAHDTGDPVLGMCSVAWSGSPNHHKVPREKYRQKYSSLPCSSPGDKCLTGMSPAPLCPSNKSDGDWFMGWSFPWPGTCLFWGMLGLGVSHRGLERAHRHPQPPMALVPASVLVRATTSVLDPPPCKKQEGKLLCPLRQVVKMDKHRWRNICFLPLCFSVAPGHGTAASHFTSHAHCSSPASSQSSCSVV